MADFKTHITTSTMVGIGFGTAGYATFDLEPATCFLAGGLCSVAGILPDVDSESGQTVREVTGFAAVLVPILLLDKIVKFHLSHETLVVVIGSMYVLVRFGLATFINRVTVHRGMWHSIPAALCAGLITSWLCLCPELFPRFFKVAAVILGYLTHLILDEYFSFELRRGRFRIKKSLGTALKIWGDRFAGNAIVYSILVLLFSFTINDPQITGKPGPHPIAEMVRQAIWNTTSPSTETRNVETLEPDGYSPDSLWPESSGPNWIDDYDFDSHKH